MKNCWREEAAQQAKRLPLCPGVYLMKDSQDTIIYVGKAKSLRKRVLQYFRKSKDRAPKVDAMVSCIHTIEHIVTDTELEAFLTECRLIKEIKPKYNRQMKNDKKYSYIKISSNERFPRISVVTSKTGRGAMFFGPYTSRSSAEKTVEFIKEHYLVRKCSTASRSRETSGCLNYSLGSCLGACRNDVDSQEYDKTINGIILLLGDKDTSPVKRLEKKMKDAAEVLEFEKAAKYRDYLKGLQHVLHKQRLIQSSLRRRNIIAIEHVKDNVCKVFLFKGNHLRRAESISVESPDEAVLAEHLRQLVLCNFTVENGDKTEAVSRQEIDEVQIIYSYLKRSRNNIQSFWIPASWLEPGNSKLSAGLSKVMDHILGIKQPLSE